MMHRIHYLTVGGKFLTPNVTTIPSPNAITGPLNSNTLCDWLSTPEAIELAVNLTIQSIGSGGSLSVFLYILDPIEPSNNDPLFGLSQNPNNPAVATLSLNPAGAITSPSTLRLVISQGQATVWINGTPYSLGAMNCPAKWQIGFAVSVSASLIGTYELKE